MLPSAAELTYFLEVSTTLNLSRASERLGISQPSLSVAIKRLEHTIGSPLFIRHKNGVTLTQAGRQLLLHARQLLLYWETTKSRALASQDSVEGCVTIGCPSPIAMYLGLHFLPNLLEQHPKLEVHLKHDISRRITEKVINLSVDVGIVINPVKHPDLVIRKLTDDETTFWVGPGKRKIQQFSHAESVLVANPDLLQTQFLLNKIKKLSAYPMRMMMVESLEIVASLTANGCGIGILPARVAQAMYPDKLKRLAKMPMYVDELCVVYRNENRQVKAIQTMVNAIKDSF